MNWYWPRRVLPRFFPAAGAVEYAIDYTTDRGGSRCLRLIPIPRNHRCRPRVRFNIFDRYPVCSLRPIIPPYTHTHKYTHTHIYISDCELSSRYCQRNFRCRRACILFSEWKIAASSYLRCFCEKRSSISLHCAGVERSSRKVSELEEVGSWWVFIRYPSVKIIDVIEFDS